jgi:Sulfotransferase family
VTEIVAAEHMSIQPIFIFSVSRSGSTLLQRVIAAHEGVATVSEPWILLPYLYTLRSRGVVAEYEHELMVAAIEDFCRELPGEERDYEAELRKFVLHLYEKAAGPDTRYFLDKTPPYCLIVEEIMRLFPEGKFVFLWRNPLSIVASIIQVWKQWHPTMFRSDLYIGLPRLVSAYRAHSARAYAVRFEDLVGGDESSWNALFEYLGIEFEPDSLNRFSAVKLNGRAGDQTGTRQYSTLSSEPQQKWKDTLGNPLRKEWCRRYLRFLGEERLAVMGYDGEQILRELNSQPMSASHLMPDLGQLARDLIREPIRIQIRRRGIGGPNVLRELLKA